MRLSQLFSRSRRRAGAAAVALVAITGVTNLASAETPSELRQQRKQVQEDAAELAAEVDAITGDVDQITEALDTLQASVDAQQAAVDASKRAVVQSETIQAQAEQAIADLESTEQRARDNLRAAAIQSYVAFQGPGDLEALGADPWGAAREETLVEFGTGTGFEELDMLRSIGAELEIQRQIADDAALEAASKRDDVEHRLDSLAIALERQEEMLIEVNTRLESRLSEVASLAALDASMAEEIRVEEQRIADAIASRRPPSGGGVTLPAGTDITVTTVRGIVVNELIADDLEGLLAAMAAEGFTLGGGGYRSIESQIRLRKAHCGTSDYAIWEMSASRCRPPTARPGLSQHELGLAIDFTYNGRVLRTRSSEVFAALSRIAPGFGFYNLPSEPWHWSTSGG